MSHHITVCSSTLVDLGESGKNPSYLLAAIYAANRNTDNDVLPDFDGTFQSYRTNSSINVFMRYSLWARNGWTTQLGFKAQRTAPMVPIPLKTWGKYVTEGSIVDSYSLLKTACKKATNALPKRLVASLKKDNSADNLTHIHLVWGIPANTTNKFMLSVLFDVIKNSTDNNILDLTYSGKDELDLQYNCHITNKPKYQRGTGFLKGYAKDDCTIQVGAFTAPVSTDTDAEEWAEMDETTSSNATTTVTFGSFTDGGITLVRQHKGWWESISGFNIEGGKVTNQVRGKDKTPTLNWIDESKKGNTGLFVPVCFDDIKHRQRNTSVSDLSHLSQLLCINVKVISIPWYARGWFKILIQIVLAIVMAVITVFTLGVGTPGAIALWTGVSAAVSATVGVAIGYVLGEAIASIVSAVVANYIVSVIISEALKEILKPLVGKKLGTVLGGMAGSFAGSWNGVGLSFLSIANMTVKLASGVSSAIFQHDLQKVQKKQNNLEEWSYQKKQEVDRAFQDHAERLLSQDVLDDVLQNPVARYQASQLDIVCKAAVVTGYDIADIQMNQIRDHYKNGTSTDIS